MLEFTDVSNDSEGSMQVASAGGEATADEGSPPTVGKAAGLGSGSREVRVRWGKDALAPPKAVRPAVEAALAVGDREAGPAAAVRRSVERVVAEFKSR